jgi:putative lipoprotein
VKRLATLVMTLALGACSTGPTTETLRGEAFYLQRIALPPNAVLSVTLADVSMADAPAQPLARYTGPSGAQVPLPFELTYDRGRVTAGHRYALTARIEAAGQLLWINTQAVPVALDGSDPQPLRVRVDQVLVNPMR